MSNERSGAHTRAGWWAVIAVVLMATVLACSSPDDDDHESQGEGPTPPSDPVRGGDLVMGTAGEVNGFNPLSSQWSGDAYVVARATTDPLVAMDREGQWQPYLAKALTPNEDFTVWTIELRPGITFHNGDALDADALKVFLDAAVTSPLSSQGFPETPTIAVVDELNVTMTFEHSWSALPVVFVEQPGYVIAPEQIESGATDTIIGTGPFVFDEWIPDDHVLVSRNDDYWQEGLPYLDSIEFRPLSDPTARENALRSGEVDMIELNTASQQTLEDLAAEGKTVIDDVDNVGSAMLLMNNDAEDLSEYDVRHAIVSAIDREAYRAAILDDSYELADQPYPEDSFWHSDEVEYPPYDLDLARQLVDDYEAENGPIELTTMVIAGPNANGPQFLQGVLGEAGIDMEIEELELSAFVRRYVAGDYETVFLGNFFGAPDPDGNAIFLTTKAAADDTLIKLNFARYRNPDVDDAIEAQRATDDRDARKAEWEGVWQAFADDLPYAFLYHEHYTLITEPEVFGLEDPTTPDGVELPTANRWAPFFTRAYVDR